MNTQLSISFNAVHAWENNPKSREILEQNRDDFNHDCWKVLKLLLQGARLQVTECAVRRITGHLPRRIADLRAYNIDIKMDMVLPEGANRKIGEYYMEPSERERVMLAMIEGLRFTKIKEAA